MGFCELTLGPQAGQTLYQLSHVPSHQSDLLFSLERTLFAVFLMSDMSSSSSSLVSMKWGVGWGGEEKTRCRSQPPALGMGWRAPGGLVVSLLPLTTSWSTAAVLGQGRHSYSPHPLARCSMKLPSSSAASPIPCR